MRERIFPPPTVRQVLQINNIPLPNRLTEHEILQFIDEGYFVQAGQTYNESVAAVEGIEGAQGKIVLFPSRFQLLDKDIEQGVKSLDWMVKIDSLDILRKIAQSENVPTALTRTFLEKNRVGPHALLGLAINSADVENPPIGAYWTRSDGHFSAWTFYRAATAAEMQEMRRRDDFPPAEMKDPKFYGTNIELEVMSRTEKGGKHDVPLLRLPISRKSGPWDYSSWLNITHLSNDPDALKRGGEHQKRIFPVYFWSTPAIYAFYEASRILAAFGEGRKFRANPFPIPANRETVGHIDNLRLRSLILERQEDGSYKLDVLNKTEIDKQIAARTILRRYENCWFHLGTRDTSYLYAPSVVRKD